MIEAQYLLTLLQSHAPLRTVPLAPELRAWHAEDELPLWSALEEAVGERIGPPFFAVAWPGAQALARLVLDDVIDVRGKRVLDVGAGSGVLAIACAMKGARAVAIDTDALACLSASLLAHAHGMRIETSTVDLLWDPLAMAADVVIAGDLVYSQTQAEPARRAVQAWLARGSRVVLADSGRPFFDACGLPCIHTATVPVPRVVEGVSEREVRVYASP